MIIEDVVWGTHEIAQPSLIELIESKSVQRLKGIAHYGLPARWYHVPGFSRYEHSVGVMLSLKTLGASVEEQAAGLLHDISHTAFSHVIDFVVGSGGRDDYQDNRHREVIENSELPQILRKHNMTAESMITLEPFKLLETDAPSLCADRLDYSMREFAYWSAPDAVRALKDSLIQLDGKIIFDSKKNAGIFARQYMRLQKEHWAGREAVARYHVLSSALRKALEIRAIDMEDFDFDDEHIISKLNESKDPEIMANIHLLGTHQINSCFTEPYAEGASHMVKKFRYVDPEFRDGNCVQRLTNVDSDYVLLLKSIKKSTSEGFWLRR